MCSKLAINFVWFLKIVLMLLDLIQCLECLLFYIIRSCFYYFNMILSTGSLKMRILIQFTVESTTCVSFLHILIVYWARVIYTNKSRILRLYRMPSNKVNFPNLSRLSKTRRFVTLWEDTCPKYKTKQYNTHPRLIADHIFKCANSPPNETDSLSCVAHRKLFALQPAWSPYSLPNERSEKLKDPNHVCSQPRPHTLFAVVKIHAAIRIEQNEIQRKKTTEKRFETNVKNIIIQPNLTHAARSTARYLLYRSLMMRAARSTRNDHLTTHDPKKHKKKPIKPRNIINVMIILFMCAFFYYCFQQASGWFVCVVLLLLSWFGFAAAAARSMNERGDVSINRPIGRLIIRNPLKWITCLSDLDVAIAARQRWTKNNRRIYWSIANKEVVSSFMIFNLFGCRRPRRGSRWAVDYWFVFRKKRQQFVCTAIINLF